MEPTIIIANWKSHMHVSEAKLWLFALSKDQEIVENPDKTIIICPPFTLLPYVHDFIKANDLSLKIGAQDVSPFKEGAFTGEIAATQIKEFAQYVIVGHSERREYFKEGKDHLDKKVEMATKAELQVIYCINDNDLAIPDGVKIVAYEPVSAIGSGNPANPQYVYQVMEKVKKERTIESFLYGGSVTGDDVKNYTNRPIPGTDGVLVGGASLNAEEFVKLIKNA